MKKGDVTFTFAENVHPTAISFNWKQWNTKKQTIVLSTSKDGTNFTEETTFSFPTTSEISASIDASVKAVRASTTNSSNQIGLQSIVLTLPDDGLGEIMYGEAAANGQTINAEGGQTLTFTSQNAAYMSIAVADHDDLKAEADAASIEWIVPAATSAEQTFSLKVESMDANGDDTKEANVTVKVAAVDNRQTLDLQFSAAEATAKMWALDEFTAPVLNNTEVDVTYASSKTEVADFEEGVLKIKAAGETDITATFAGNDTYKPTTASYKLTVETLAKPVFSVSSGDINIGDSFEITCATEGAAISYTIDGGEAIEYTGAITVSEEGTFTYIATATLGTQTTTTQKTYTVMGVPTFDFTSNGYGMTATSDNGTYETEKTAIESNGVTIDFTGKYRWWQNTNSKATDLRLYTGATMKFSVAAGLLISEIEFVSGDKFNITGVTNSIYTPNAPAGECTLTCGGTSFIRAIYVTTIAAAPAATVDGQPAGEALSLDGKEKIELVLTATEGASIWYKITMADGEEVQNAIAYAQAGFTKAESNPTILTITKACSVDYYTELNGKDSEVKTIQVTGQTTGVENVIVEHDQNAEYFDFTGRRVLNPASGLYIKVVGGKASKTYIR